MGNEILDLRKDLIDLDIEEMKINRELYNLQLEINAKLARDKKVRLKQNFKEIAGKKIKYLEEKKRLLIENENNSNDNNNKGINKSSTNENKILYNAVETGVAKNGEVKKSADIKLNLVNNSNNNKKNNKESHYKQKEIISSSESDNYVNVKTIYTRKNTNLQNLKKEKEIKKNEEEDLKKSKNDEEEKKEGTKNNNTGEDKKYNNYRYLNKNNDNDTNENINENLNINEYKRKFFDKLSSLCPRSNYNKSMDNKNSSIVEELEVVGLSQNDILKDKLSEFFVGTSVATSNNKQNNSSLHNNYGRPKSEISGINRQLISSSKSNTENGNNEGVNSINYQNNINIESQEFVGGENKKFGTGATKEKYDTEETINNKETGNNTDEKYKEQNNENAVLNDKRLLRNNRNKSYFILEGSSSLDN